MQSRRRGYQQRARPGSCECSSETTRNQGTSPPQSLLNLCIEGGSEGRRTVSRDSSPGSRNSAPHSVSVSVNHYPNDGYRDRSTGIAKWIIAILAIVLAVVLINVVKYVNISGVPYFDEDMKDVQDQVLGVKMTIAKLEMAKQEMEEITSQIHFMLNDIRDLATTLADKRKKRNCKDSVSDGSKSQTELSEFPAYSTDCTENEEMIDFALAGDGGIIISTLETENYREPDEISFLGITLCSTVQGAEVILQPDVIPGTCWAFRGQHGSVIIQLVKSVQVTGITIDHIPKEFSPYDLDSAPKDFSVYGVNGDLWTDPKARIYYGQFTYMISSTPSQFFPIDKVTYAVTMVELRFLNNNGNTEYTCIYRVRIHGNTDSDCEVDSE